jgi:two-component system sensor histidine kinase CpxA
VSPLVRSLFWKIFLWFWLAMVLVSLTLILSSAWSQSRTTRERDEAMDRAMTPLMADNFAEVYDKQGKNGLEEFIARGHGTFPWNPFLFDQNGHEVLDRTLSPNAVGAMRLAAVSHGTEIVRSGGDRWIGQYVLTNSGRPYVLVLEVNRHGPEGVLHVPSEVQLLQFLIVLLIVGLISLWITRHITSPIVQLRGAANQLARGQLSARVGPETLGHKDELSGLGKDFNHMAEQIELLMTSQRRLIADISHELRSPLARLSVALGLARRSADPETDASLNRIERETQRLNELIGGLLDLARLESGTETLKAARVDLQELVSSVAEDAAFEAGARNRGVRVLSTFSCSRKGNAQLLRSAIENAVRNAVNYTSEGTEVEISLGPSPDQQSAVVLIRDHGPGVPDSALQNIFEPFFRVDDARDRVSGGTGLGLSITDRVVRAHGGNVRAHNHPDSGLVIELILPLC